MLYQIHSYRFAEEIIEHPNYNDAFIEIFAAIENCPLFIWENKSERNSRLDIVQQLMNAYFDVKFSCESNWEFHPNATGIPDSGLAADFKRKFNDLTIQIEVQFGNMARWYSDVFKFQTAYSQNLIKMGICIVPFSEIANRMDSNVTNFERCVRELPSAELSITLPILLVGIKPDSKTNIIDVKKSKFDKISEITGKGKSDNRYRIINGIIAGTDISEISSESPIGNRPTSNVSDDED